MENGPAGARYNATSHGWFETSTFVDWFRTIYIPHARTLSGPKVLIGDNLSSHFSEEVILLAQQENSYFVCLPANCTHIAQPLDVAFFSPLKRLWRNILFKYKEEHPKERLVQKHDFPDLMNKVWQELHSDNKAEMNLKAGFKTCGVFPFDKAQVMKKIDKSVAPGVDKVEALSDAVLDYMKSLRVPEPAKNRGKKKKVTTAPGKSVSIDDFVKNDTPAVSKKRKISTESSSDEEFIETYIPKKKRKFKSSTRKPRKVALRKVTQPKKRKVRKQISPSQDKSIEGHLKNNSACLEEKPIENLENPTVQTLSKKRKIPSKESPISIKDPKNNSACLAKKPKLIKKKPTDVVDVPKPTRILAKRNVKAVRE